MAGVKISELPAATTPLAGTELLAIVQGGVTKQASADDVLSAPFSVYTVATLPSATVAYRRFFVSDANATTFNSVVAGGGANKVPVFSDGTNWRIG